MNIKTTYFTIFFLFFSILFSFGQKKDLVIVAKNKKKLKKQAEWAYETGDVFVAKGYYEKLLEIDSDNAEFIFKLASCEMMARNYADAETLFKEAHEKNLEEYPTALYYWALMQKANGKYSEAKDNFEKFGKMARRFDDKSWSKKNKNELAGCQFAMSIEDSLELMKVSHLEGDVNYPHIEFSPIPLDNGDLVYGSNKTEEVLYYEVKKANSKKKNTPKKMPVRKLYIASNKNGKWRSQGEWDGPFNQGDEHAGNGIFSLDRNRFFFTKCAKNEKGKTICKIYSTEKDGSSWSKATLLNENINLKNYTNTQPCIGLESRRGREVLYFVSDRPDGKGDWDIWYSIYNAKKKTFSTVKNAGRKINTKGRECTPYYEPLSKKMYFSSDGHPSLGGLDIFEISGEKTKWEEAKNLGSPVNSSADDLDFILAKGAKNGFLVSNRKGGKALDNETCCDDIYAFSVIENFDVDILLKITDNNNENIDDINIKVFVRKNGKEELLEEKRTKGNSLQITIPKGEEYWIEVSKTDFETNGIPVDTRGAMSSKKIEKTVSMIATPKTIVNKSPPPIQKESTKTPTIIKKEPIVLENVYFDFNSAELTTETKETINTILLRFLNKNKRSIVEIAAHTDSKGSDSYNLELSQRRAQSVVNYLISKGINSKRLVARGYGESLPVMADINLDGSINEEAGRRNRRVEFSVVGKL